MLKKNSGKNYITKKTSENLALQRSPGKILERPFANKLIQARETANTFVLLFGKPFPYHF